MNILPKNLVLATVLGGLIWVIAFIIGAIVLSLGFEQSFISIVLSPVNVLMLLIFFWVYFDRVKMKKLVGEGFLLGVVWLLVNVVLDLLILIPMMKVDYATWFMTIGIKYLAMPVETAALGFVIEQLK